MARIRTIKPEFFTSESIVGLPPLARLLFIATWLEADREGRFIWKPKTLKLRYLPGDACDIDALATELVDAGLVVLYEVLGKRYAEIPTFTRHQVINNREAASVIPPRNSDASSTPEARESDASSTRDDACGTPLVGMERKGASSTRHVTRDTRPARGTRLPADWSPSDELKSWSSSERPDLDLESVVAQFRDYWLAKPGRDGTKLDWEATFRNWVRNQRGTTLKQAHDPFVGAI
jgi:hypothetical protein